MPAAGKSNTELLDLINATKQAYVGMGFDVALKYQRHEVVDRWFGGDQVVIHSGESFIRNVMLDSSGNAQWVRLFQESDVNITDVMSRIAIQWTQLQTQWSWERRELLRNQEPAAWTSLIRTRKVDGLVDFADKLEERAWQTPSSSTDDLHPNGIPYWVPKIITTPGEGFYGGAPDGWAAGSAVGGITPGGTNDNTPSISGGKPYWRSYSAGGTGYYTGSSAINSTAMKTLRKAFLKINFQSPRMVRDLYEGPLSNYRIYVNANTLVAYEDYVTKANDSVGVDGVRFADQTTFKRIPPIYIPYLDADTTDPWYLINHSKFHALVQEGDFMRESEAMNDRKNHNTFTVFMDLSLNFFCDNRRCQAVVNAI